MHRQIVSTGRWLQGLLDAYIAVIHNSEGDSTPLGQRSLCVVPVVYRVWASVLAHIQDWFCSWVPDSVFSAGEGVFSDDAWFSTIDIDLLELPAWFRKVYFAFHEEVWLQFKLATGLGVAWTGDASVPQRCPLRMVFTAALYAPQCRYLENLKGITPSEKQIT